MNLAIIDFNRTIYDPEANGLVPGALSMLEILSAAMPLVLVSKMEPGRGDILRSLGVEHFFAEKVFTPAKSPELFIEIIERHGAAPDSTYVIGDYIIEEIAYGNRIGAKTIRLKRGKFADRVPTHPDEEAWRTVDDLLEIEGLLK